MERSAETVIVMPTLDLQAAAKTMQQARETAGIPTAAVLISDQERRGAVFVNNVGFEAALAWGARYIVYLNDDCRCEQQGWLRRLIEVLASDPSFGVAAPSGMCRGGPQMMGKPGEPPGYEIVAQPLAWFCAVCKREVFETVGLFDSTLIHYCDESDFEMRAREEGWKSVWVRDVYVNHAVGIPIAEWWEADKRLYNQRWAKR